MEDCFGCKDQMNVCASGSATEEGRDSRGGRRRRGGVCVESIHTFLPR